MQIRCTGCHKIIGEVRMRDGTVKIQCKCGVTNTVTAEPKQSREGRSFQDRLNITKK